MTTKSENRLKPASAIVAMLLAASTIVGLAWWVGDAMAPELASLVYMASEAPAPPVVRVMAPSPAPPAGQSGVR